MANWRSDPPVSKVLTIRNRRAAECAGWLGARLAALLVATRSFSHRCGSRGWSWTWHLSSRIGHVWKREQYGRPDEFLQEIAMPQLEHQQAPQASGHGAAAMQVIVHQLANAVGNE